MNLSDERVDSYDYYWNLTLAQNLIDNQSWQFQLGTYMMLLTYYNFVISKL